PPFVLDLRDEPVHPVARGLEAHACVLGGHERRLLVSALAGLLDVQDNSLDVRRLIPEFKLSPVEQFIVSSVVGLTVGTIATVEAFAVKKLLRMCGGRIRRASARVE